MVEEFLEKLPEIDTRYEVSTKRFYCSSSVSTMRSVASMAARLGHAIVSRQQQQQQPPARHPVVLLVAVCFAVQITFANKHLHYADSPQRVEPS